MTDQRWRITWAVLTVALAAFLVWATIFGSPENPYLHVQRVIVEMLAQ